MLKKFTDLLKKLQSFLLFSSEHEIPLKQILEAVPLGLTVHQSDGHLLYLNQAGKQILGDGAIASVLIKPWNAFYRSETSEIYPLEQFPILQALQGKSACAEDIEIRKNQLKIPLEVRATPIFNQAGKVIYAIATFQDITERQQGQKTLKAATTSLETVVKERTQALTHEIHENEASQHQLERLTHQLTYSNRKLEQFAYSASHDLQEPLRAIANFSQLLAERYQGKLDETADQYINFIVEGTHQLQQMIQDLLTYSRLGNQELNWQPVDCNLILQRVQQNLQVAIAQTQATITSDPLPIVIADATQLTYLLQNLIANSLKYRSSQPPHIQISAQLSPGVRNPNSNSDPQNSGMTQTEWLFSIQDNGIGLDPQFADQIFIIFQRLHTVDEYPGTGLGLAICQTIIERHGGRIWVESQVGQGAIFYFTLPLSVKL